MILGAGLLLLLGLGLLVAGVLTGVTALYWGCVVVCLIAAVLLVVVRRQMAAERDTAERGADVGGRPPADEGRTWIPTAPQPPDRAADRAPDPQTIVPPAGATASGLASEHPRQPEPQQPVVREPEVREPVVREPVVREPEERQPEVRHAEARRRSAPETAGEPPLEEVEVTDLLVVMDLRDEVLVVDEHPRYHLGGCRYLEGRETFPLPIDEARSDGFTPCGSCAPDRHLAQQSRERKAGRRP